MIFFSVTIIILFLGVGMTIIIVPFFIYVSSTKNIIIANVSVTFCQFIQTRMVLKKPQLLGEFTYYNRSNMNNC